VVDDEMDSVSQIEKSARQLQAPELVAAADDSLIAIEDIDPRYGVDVSETSTRRDGTDG
jgi:DNA recombination protein RmuC